MPQQPSKYDLKANVPVDVKLDRVYQNAGEYGPYIRIIAWIREPTETQYVHRSILTDYTLLGQLYQLGFAEEEDKTNDDDLAFVKVLKDGETDVLRLVLEEHRNERSGKKFTQGRITHVWDQALGLWADAPEPTEGAPPAQEPAGPSPAGPTPGEAPVAAAGPVPATITEVAAAAPGAIPAGSPQVAPIPAPTSGRTKHDPITIAYAYHMARIGVAATGVNPDDLVAATTTVFIEIMRNEPPPPSSWFRGKFEVSFDATGDDDLPF